MRLDRLLSNAHVGTRSQVKKLIKENRVKINGKLAEHSSQQVDEDMDEIMVDDQIISYEKYCYIMLHKPAGYISATEGNVPTVMDLIHESYSGMFPCGRLDKDTEGLLLITNDGPLAHTLLSPRHHVEKEYYVEHTAPLTDNDIQQMEEGITFQDETYQPAKITHVKTTSCHVIIQEGKYHQIKNMFRAIGDKVTYLKRLRMKNLILDETLKPGQYRFLKKEEIEDLKAD